MGAVPRRTVEASFTGKLVSSIRGIRTRLDRLERSASLRNSSISGGEGQKIYDDDGNLRLSIDTRGSVTAYDAAGVEVARYGRLFESAPGEYGVEILVDDQWVRLGYQTTGWTQIQKPSGYDPATDRWSPRPHTHAGTDITSSVTSAVNATNATNATEAAHAADADGSVRAYNNEPGGTGSFYQVWVDANQKLCRNTSSQRYKDQITPWMPSPAAVLAIQPVRYRRKSTGQTEFGVIAEQTHEHVPDLTVWFRDKNGNRIDGFRYDLLAVAQQSVLRAQQAQLAAQQTQINKLTTDVLALGGKIT